MKKALFLIPAALLLFSCARSKREGVDKKKEKESGEVKQDLPSNISTNFSKELTLNLDSCSHDQLVALVHIQNMVDQYNANQTQENENHIQSACVSYDGQYHFDGSVQCEFIYNEQVVNVLQFSDALWDSVCIQFQN
jgi:hypothetical protein